MARFGSWVSLALLSLACSKNAPSPSLVPPWQVLVTGVRPGHAAAPPALSVCEADGKGCTPIKSGVQLSGNKLVRMERGVGEFKLDANTTVEIAEGSELLLEDKQGRALELRSGGIVLSRSAASKEAGSLLVRMVDRTLELVGRSSIVATLDNINRGQLFVSHGVVNAVEPAGATPPLRAFHPGEGAVFERKAPPNLQALFAGQVSRLRQSVLAVQDTPPPPKTVIAPRGLGTMTARVPGTTAVVSGVRLAQHHVKAVVRDGVAQTEVEEVFANDTDRVLEGRYVFPLPADATISGLTLFVGDKPVEGELVEKKRAAAIFKGIVEDTVRPRDPALLEWVSGSEFSLKVFPLPAKGSRKVVLRYQQVLTADGPRQVYTYPLSFGSERRTPIDDLAIDIDLSDAGGAVQGVVASGYAATVQPGALGTRVALHATATAPDHDFAVSFKRAAPGQAVATVEQGFVAIRLRAELPDGAPVAAFQRRDRVLVVDASHSQSAESLAASRELALGMLRGLDADERFALLVCESACDALPPTGLLPATGKALSDAQAFLKDRKPAGASDVAGALLAATERVPTGAPVQVIYLGDGSPSAGELSVSSIVARVRPSFDQRGVDLRLLGAGPSVDELTLSGLARELSGSYQSVTSAGPLADQIEVLTAGLRSPLLVAPRVELPASVSEVQPRVLPNLRLGEEFVVVGKSTASAPLDVTLRGTLARAPYALTQSVTVKANSAPYAPRLWAESRIADLSASSDASAVREVIELSKRFRVMSRQTSWLVLENEQMFAEFGIPRSKPPVEAAPAGAEGSPAGRAALSQELDSLSLGALAGVDSSARPSDVLSAPKADAAAEPTKPSAPAPAAKAPAAPSPAPPSANQSGGSGLGESRAGSDPGTGGLGGLGSTGAGAADASVSGPRSNTGVGGAAVSGGSVSNAARVAAGMRAGFRSCHQRVLQTDPTAAGTLRLLIKVGKAGEVTSVNSVPSGNVPPALVACVTARARAAQFDPPEGGSATIAVPVTFTIQDGGLGPVRRPGLIARPFRAVEDVAVIRAGDELWLAQGQVALDKLQADLAASPESRKRNEALVRGLLLRGRFLPARAAAEHFVELDPDLPVARELLAYAAVATGDFRRAVAAIDAMAETAATDIKAQGRAARAFEALGDEARACAHWRSVAELAPSSDAALFDSLRCRARVMGDKAGAIRDAKAVAAPGPLLKKLLPLLESGQVPAFEKSSGSAGQFEASLSCEPQQDCPYLIVITPTGTVFSPWTPALGRSSPSSFAFSGLLTGVYHVLLVGGAPSARGKVELRALSARNTFQFAPGHAPTISSTQVTMAPQEQALGGGGLLGIR